MDFLIWCGVVAIVAMWICYTSYCAYQERKSADYEDKVLNEIDNDTALEQRAWDRRNANNPKRVDDEQWRDWN